MDTAALHQPTNPVRFVTAASLFDGHDASINIMRRLLQAQAAAEYAYSMTSYHQAVITRLTAYLHKATEVQDV